jgi:hypothetical protein
MNNKLEVIKEYQDKTYNLIYGYEVFYDKLASMYKVWHNRPTKNNYRLQREWWIDKQGCRLIYDASRPDITPVIGITPAIGYQWVEMENIIDILFLAKLRGRIE